MREKIGETTTKDQNEGIKGQNKPIEVFISYSHDSEQHKSHVKKLADRLKNDGIYCILDQDFENKSPEEGWASLTERKISEADYVLIVCTEIYYNRIRGKIKSDEGRGVKWEFDLIRKLIYTDDSQYHRLIPVLFSKNDEEYIPDRLSDLPHYSPDSKAEYKKMFKRISGQIKKNVIEKEAEKESNRK